MKTCFYRTRVLYLNNQTKLHKLHKGHDTPDISHFSKKKLSGNYIAQYFKTNAKCWLKRS